MGESRPPRVVRNPWNVVVSWVFFPMLYFFATLALANGEDIGFWVAVAAVSMLAHWRFARLGIVVRDEVVIVRNFTRTRRIAWTDVDRFASTDTVTMTPVVILKDGRTMTLTGLAPPRTGGLAWLGPRLRLLNSCRDRSG